MTPDNSKVALTLDNILQQTKLSRNEICCKLRELIDATESGGGGTSYNTARAYNVVNNTQTLQTIHSLSFSVITGTATVSFDGGSTSVIYPTGSNVSLEATTTFASNIIFTVDASSRVIIQTMS